MELGTAAEGEVALATLMPKNQYCFFPLGRYNAVLYLMSFVIMSHGSEQPPEDRSRLEHRPPATFAAEVGYEMRQSFLRALPWVLAVTAAGSVVVGMALSSTKGSVASVIPEIMISPVPSEVPALPDAGNSYVDILQ